MLKVSLTPTTAEDTAGLPIADTSAVSPAHHLFCAPTVAPSQYHGPLYGTS